MKAKIFIIFLVFIIGMSTVSATLKYAISAIRDENFCNKADDPCICIRYDFDPNDMGGDINIYVNTVRSDCLELASEAIGSMSDELNNGAKTCLGECQNYPPTQMGTCTYDCCKNAINKLNTLSDYLHKQKPEDIAKITADAITAMAQKTWDDFRRGVSKLFDCSGNTACADSDPVCWKKFGATNDVANEIYECGTGTIYDNGYNKLYCITKQNGLGQYIYLCEGSQFVKTSSTVSAFCDENDFCDAGLCSSYPDTGKCSGDMPTQSNPNPLSCGTGQCCEKEGGCGCVCDGITKKVSFDHICCQAPNSAPIVSTVPLVQYYYNKAYTGLCKETCDGTSITCEYDNSNLESPVSFNKENGVVYHKGQCCSNSRYNDDKKDCSTLCVVDTSCMSETPVAETKKCFSEGQIMTDQGTADSPKCCEGLYKTNIQNVPGQTKCCGFWSSIAGDCSEPAPPSGGSGSTGWG